MQPKPSLNRRSLFDRPLIWPSDVPNQPVWSELVVSADLTKPPSERRRRGLLSSSGADRRCRAAIVTAEGAVRLQVRTGCKSGPVADGRGWCIDRRLGVGAAPDRPQTRRFEGASRAAEAAAQSDTQPRTVSPVAEAEIFPECGRAPRSGSWRTLSAVRCLMEEWRAGPLVAGRSSSSLLSLGSCIKDTN